jgi:hypothetical protein
MRVQLTRVDDSLFAAWGKGGIATTTMVIADWNEHPA